MTAATETLKTLGSPAFILGLHGKECAIGKKKKKITPGVIPQVRVYLPCVHYLIHPSVLWPSVLTGPVLSRAWVGHHDQNKDHI